MINIEPRHNAHSVSILRAHLVFIPKFREDVLRFRIREAAETVIEQICRENNILLMSKAIEPEHIHLMVDYPPDLSISKIAQYIKGKSSYLLRKKFGILHDFCSDVLWAKGYFVSSVGSNLESVQKYINSQGSAI